MKNSKTVRLTLMMFFQYLFFAVWWVPLAAYLTNMDVGSTQKALILSSMAIGCLFSPLIGMIADKYFPSEKVLAFLNALTAILLLGAGLATNPNVLFIFLLFAMICHMPTWGLTSAITMSHAPSENFARIRVFGSIGWVASGLCSLFTVKVLGLDFDGTNLPFFYGAGFALVATLVNFTLPKTPPPAKGEKGSVVDALGLNTLKLMKDKNFAVFIIVSFLVMIPFSMYWSYCSQFLQAEDFKYISITMNWGQVAEMLLLLSVPFMLRKFKIKMTLIAGLLFLTIRYSAFYFGILSDITRIK
jgi:predicted MFS family arabinose efflux permease